MAGPLENLRVVDLTTVMMGPYATQILADFGADVIKIESHEGDQTRDIGPYRNQGMGALFLQANRGKRSLVLDLKHADGRAAFLKLVEETDVIVTNIRPGAIRRLNLTYEDVAAVNPRVVYVSLLGYGRNGPYAERPAYDDLVQGAVGLPSLYQAAGSGQPSYAPVTFADRVVGLYSLSATLSALWLRERAGVGQQVDVPMFEVMSQFVLADHMAGRLFDPPQQPMGYGRLLSKGRRPYRTKDGYVCALMLQDTQWRRFFTVMGKGELFESDRRFATIDSRTRHADEINAIVAEEMACRTTKQCIELLESADIPVMPLNSLDSLVDDPHLAAVNFFAPVKHPSEGALLMPSIPIQFSASPAALGRPAPLLGEHSREILKSLGYGDERIDEMLAAGVTAEPAPNDKGRIA